MRIRVGFLWFFNGIEKSYEFRNKVFYGVVVYGFFRRYLNLWFMKKLWLCYEY